MKNEILKNVLNVKKGSTNFSFSLLRTYSRFTGTAFTVFIEQQTGFTESERTQLGMEDFQCTWKVYCPHSKTEFSAINYAGKRYIKDWVNI